MRILRRKPGFAAVAIFTIALGIGATTLLFSIANGVLLKPLPWPEADRVVRVTETRKGQAARLKGTISNGPYLAWRDDATTVEALGGYSIGATSVNAARGNGDPVRLRIGRITASMFQVLRAAPLRGRLFTDVDSPAGSHGADREPSVAILSFGLWQDWFGGRDEAIGSSVRLDDMPVTIVGVMPREFAFPDLETRAWLPMPIGAVMGDSGVRRIMIFGAMARLKPGVTPQQAGAEATARARTAPDPGFAAVAMFGSNGPPDVSVVPAVDAMTAEVRPAIVLLLAAVALLLATATANTASLQLAHATTRRREMALRAAIGADGGRIVRQLVVESALVSSIGGVAGLGLVVLLHRALPSLLPADFPRVADIAIDLRVLALVIVLSTVTSLVCGLLPALQVSQVDVTEALAEGGPNTAAGSNSRSARWRAIVMAGQVAVASVLLVGAALLGRSFVALLHADRGYDPTNVLTARLDLPRGYDPSRRVAFADAVVERMRAIAGVEHAAAGNSLPFMNLGISLGTQLPSPTNPAIKVQVHGNVRLVSPDYFAALRLPLVQGRLLTGADDTSSPAVVVSRSFAAQYLGDRPLGAHLPIRFFGEDRQDWVVAGVVGDMRQASVTDPQAPDVFVGYRQAPGAWARSPVHFVVRTAGDPTAQVSALRTAVREQDRTIALDSIMTLEERLAASLANPRLYAVVLGGFALTALAISCVGLFGVLSYGVAQRTREIGVRTALGAQPFDVMLLVLRQGLVVVVAGVTVALWVAVFGGKLLARFLYGVGPHDAASFAGVAVLVVVVSGAACLVPARRAARVDPLSALRS